MAVALSRTGPTATFAVSVDVADLITEVQAGRLTLAQAKLAAARRALQHFREAVEAAATPDADLDERVTTLQAVVARLKASRPTGNL